MIDGGANGAIILGFIGAVSLVLLLYFAPILIAAGAFQVLLLSAIFGITSLLTAFVTAIYQGGISCMAILASIGFLLALVSFLALPAVISLSVSAGWLAAILGLGLATHTLVSIPYPSLGCKS